MAKKYKDTSPLAMGRKQKGSAVNKKKKKDDVKTGEKAVTNVASRSLQSSVSKNKPGQANNQATSQTRRTYSSKNNSGVAKAIQEKQDPLRINQRNTKSYGTQPTQTVKERYAKDNYATAKEMRDAREAKDAKRYADHKEAEKWTPERMNEVYQSKRDEWAKGSKTRQKILDSNRAVEEVGAQSLKKMKSEYEGLLRRSADRKASVPDPFIENITTEEERKKAKEQNLAKLSETKKEGKEAELALEKNKKGKSWLSQQALDAEASFYNYLPGIVLGSAAGKLGMSSKVGLADIYARTLESTRGQVKEKAGALRDSLAKTGNYTPEELDEAFKNVDRWDLANAHAQAALEAGTELLGEGIGPMKTLAGGPGIFDKVFRKLVNRGVAKSGIRRGLGNLGIGIAGEIGEEEINGPAGAFASNLIYGNKLQSMQEDAIRRSNYEHAEAIQSMIQNPQDLQRYLADLNSNEFFSEIKGMYKESGSSDVEATDLANITKSFFEAAAENDEEKMQQYNKLLVEKLSGGDKSLKEAWTMQDAINVAASTAIMVTATSAGGVVSTAQAGNDFVNSNGIEAVSKMAGTIERYDEGNHVEGMAVKDAIAEGKDISGTQVFEVIQKSGEVAQENLKREETGRMVAQKKMAQEDLRIQPFVYNADGSYSINAPETARRYNQIVENATQQIESDPELNISSENAEVVAEIKAAFDTGAITANEIDEILSNDEVREGFEKVTGIDLDQYTVKNRNGEVNQVKTNIAIQEGLFVQAAENYVESARIEQEAWNDSERTTARENLTRNMDGTGSTVVTNALNNVDPRDRSKFMLTGSAVRTVYEDARYGNSNWASVSGMYKEMFSGVEPSVLKDAFDAAKADKAAAESKYVNKQVQSGDQMTRQSIKDESPVYVVGTFTDARGDKTQPRWYETMMLTEFANVFGVNIEMVDDLSHVKLDEQGNPVVDDNGNIVREQDEGLFDPKTNTIKVNVNKEIEKSVQEIAEHELLHNIAAYAPKQYIKFSRYVMDACYRSDPEGTKRLIARKQKQYKETVGQDLTIEQAFEEMLANGQVNIDWTEDRFMNDITSEPTVWESVKNAFTETLRKLRSILSSDTEIYDKGRGAVLNQVLQTDETYRLLVNAAQAARKNKAEQDVNEWGENKGMKKAGGEVKSSPHPAEGRISSSNTDVNTENEKNVGTRYSIGKIVGASGKDYGRGVILDSKKFEGLNTTKEIRDEMLFIANSFAGDAFIAKNPDGEYVEIVFAPKAKFNNKKGRPTPAYSDLKGKNIDNPIKRETVALADEMIATSRYQPGQRDANYSHGWLDNYGQNKWEYRTVIVQDMDGNVYKANLNIANAKDGRKILYDIDPIDLLEEGNADVRRSIKETDADYMDAVNRGDMQTARQMVYEAANRTMPNSLLREGQAIELGDEEDGTLLPMYHGSGTPNFTEFNLNDGMLGNGAYFASDWTEAGDYAISALVDAGEITELEDGDYEWDGDTYDTGSLIEALEDDGYVRAFYVNVTDEEDISGSHYGWGNVIALARNKEQIKSADPVTYDDEGNVIPLSERFNQSNPDIRYSITETDSDGKKLSEGQREFFKDSKAVDENGNLLVLYHSTPAEFTVFDNGTHGENTGHDNTSYGHFVTDYRPFSERFGENVMPLYANIKKLAIHPWDASLKYEDDAFLDQITREWLEIIDPEQLDWYEEAKEDDPDLSLYDYYNSLWAPGESPYENADYDREMLEEAGYDAIELFEGTEEQLSDGKGGTDRAVTTYTIFNSNQLKRVDNLNPTEDEDIRYSIAELWDDDYMNAVESGDMGKAQQIVYEAGRAAGFGTRLYHGTTEFGFTEIETSGLESKSDGAYYEWSPFFATDSLEVAQTYSSQEEVKRISDASEPFDEEAFEDEYNDAVNSLVGVINSFAETYNYMDYSVNPFASAYKELQTTSHPVDDITENLIDNVSDIISEIAWSRAVDYVEAHPEENIDEDVYADDLQEGTEADSIWVKLDIVTDLLRSYDMNIYGGLSSGNYELLTNTDNLMVVDAKGHRWNDIPFDQIPDKRGYYRTRQLAEIARDEGYDGIQISNLFDDGGKGKGKRQKNPATVYIFFKPKEQVKSADPITYDDAGEVIPLSERFSANNPDIRWSLPEGKAEEVAHDIGPDIRFSVGQFRNAEAKAKFIASLNGGKGGFAGLSEITSGREILLRTMNKNNFDPEQSAAVVGFLEHMASYLESDKLQMRFNFIGWKDITDAEVTVRRDADDNIVSVAVSAMVVNGEYPVNFDMTTICNKREGIMEVIQALTQKYDADTGKTVLNSIKLTDEKMWAINKALKAEGIDTACLGCFVEARRYYTNRFIDKIDDVWNTAVRDARRRLGLPEEEYFNFAKGKKVSGEDYNQVADLWTAYDESTESKRSPAQRIKILMDEIVKNKEVDSPYLKLISAEDILTPEGIRGFKELSTHRKDRDMVKMIKSIYGTSAPKEILAFTPYNSEIALLPDKIKGIDTSEYLKSIGGTRVQSFSDFKMEHFFDHMQMVAEEAARGFVNHGYSKVIAYPRLFGLTGRKINMSVMFDVLPAAKWQEALGCDPDKAIEIAEKYQGLRFVKEKPAKNYDNRPYKEVTLEGVHGYLTYLVSDADYVNGYHADGIDIEGEYDKLYKANIAAGMTPEAARRKANTDKPFEQSINYREAVELQNKEGYKENIGIIAVAFGNEHFKMLLDDPNVRYIIPYHRSGLPVFIAQKTALDIAQDYTDFQNTNKAKRGLWTSPSGVSERMKSKYEKFVAENPTLEFPAITFFDQEINGKGYTVEFGKKSSKEKISLAGTGTFDVYENLGTVKDIREISNAYLEHCINNNQVPVFHEFAGHPNYYKVLFDFAVTDGTTTNIYPQKPVKNIYPGLDLESIVASGKSIEDLTEEDWKPFYDEIERGLAEQNAKVEVRRNRLGNVLDDDILSLTGENSIIAGTNVQHIVNGTPDYTNPRYSNEDIIPEKEDPDIKRSIKENLDDMYMNAVDSGNMEAAQTLVDKAAYTANYVSAAYHGTPNGGFTVFGGSQTRNGASAAGVLWFAAEEEHANVYRSYPGGWPKAENPQTYHVYLDTGIWADIGNGRVEALDYSRNGEGEASKDLKRVAKQIAAYTQWEHRDQSERGRAKKIEKTLTDIARSIYADFVWQVTETKEFADLCIEQGLDSVVAWEEHHDGDGKSHMVKTWGVFKPEQIKLSDPVTYAEDGSVIPLSERFDPNNDDIRYSLPSQDTDGKILSDGQMEYFKNSQARDSQGKLVPVYHTTKHGGFSVFDPMYSNDNRSLFFTPSFDMSQTYADHAARPIDLSRADERPFSFPYEFANYAAEHLTEYGWDPSKDFWENTGYASSGQENTARVPNPKTGTWETVSGKYQPDVIQAINELYGRTASEQRGYYECYLNLENPLIVDAKGSSWSAIPYGDEKQRTWESAETTIDKVALSWEVDNDGDIVGIDIEVSGQRRKDYPLQNEWERWTDGNYTNIDDFAAWSAIEGKTNDERRQSFLEASAIWWYDTNGLNLYDESFWDIMHKNKSQINNNLSWEWQAKDDSDTLFFDGYGDKVYDVEIYTTRELATLATNKGYDGVVIRNVVDYGSYVQNPKPADVYIAFSANQVKDINNLDPTENPDIRYSVPEEDEIRDSVARRAGSIDDIPLRDPVLEQNRVRYSLSVDAFERMIKDGWDEHYRTYGNLLDDESVRPHVISMMSQIMKESETGRKYKSDVLDETVKDMRAMYFMMKKGLAEEFADRAWHAAERIVDSIDFNDDLYVEYKGMRDYLAKRKIQIPEALVYDEDFIELVRDNNGKMRFETKGSKIETVYKYMRKHYPELFPEDIDDPVDMLLQMDYVLQLTDPYRDAYTSEEYADLVKNVADTICEMVREGDEYRSVADDLYEKFDARTKALKQRHKEALAKVREQEKAKRQRQSDRANKWKQKYKERIQKDKAEKQERKDKAFHKKKFARIEDNYKKLCKWVLEPTKDKNVPEEFRKSLAEFLQTLDLQTENSKALEAKTGHVGSKTLKMRELKDRLLALSESYTNEDGEYTPATFEIDNNVRFILEKLADKLDGRSIDELDNEDIESFDVFMKLLIRNIQRYKQVKLETKNAELSEVTDRIVDFMVDRIKRDGLAGTRKGLPGAIDKINATALTPAYLFDRMGPLKEMYDVLRFNGFDTYIRNEAMIIDKMKEILQPYYNKPNRRHPRPGSVIEEWRDDRSAQTIKLTHGSVTMSVAQMMSLYCLANRGTQATDHMTCGGIFVTPIQTGSKIEAAKEHFKKKPETSQRRVLTQDDILTIIGKLTPEQKKVADALQQIMSKEMAKLGNEAHRELYGYNNFNDPNYFPIKVHGNEISTDINNIGQVVEKIKSYGPAKPVVPGAKNALVIDDIFTVVADHCNGMNLYNAYLVPITDFMKVLNSSKTYEDGTVVTVKDAIEQAYGKDVLKYIMNLMMDINGIKSGNRGGLEDIMNSALGRAKRAAVFGNIRVALQQPTAIVRALAVVDPKYFTPFINVAPEKGVKEEMYKYCPIAQWKSWGYYDTYMGRDIEDVMMNTWSMSDVALSGIYGELDNWTWSLIWRAVKAEQAEAHPEMDTRSEEFLKMCGRRASEVFDKTQVVDSTFHRSDAMRNKQIAAKLFTAFMAEPTLTLNVFRAGLYNAAEEAKNGNKAKAHKIRARAISVIVLQAAIVSAAQAFADAWRGKDPGLPWDDDDDDDDETNGYFVRWIHNFTYNLFDQLHLENNMYLVKDVTPYINYMVSKAAEHWNWNPTLRAIMGWDQDYLYSQNNLVFAGFENTANGVAQVFKKLEKGDDYDKDWYDIIQKVSSGIGTVTGFPVGTLMRDFGPVLKKIFAVAFAADTELEKSVSESKGEKSSKKKGKDEEEETTSDNIPTKEDLPDSLTDEQKEEIIKQAKKRSEKAAEKEELSEDDMLYKALKSASGLEGEEFNKKVYSSVANGLKQYIADGDYASIAQMRDVIEQAGGDTAYFDQRVLDETKTAYKKAIGFDQTPEERFNMKSMYRYMLSHGMTQEQISADILYSSNLAKDMKVAYRLNNRDLMMQALVPLSDAGITREDLEKLYKNRNKMDLTKYNGRFKDQLKSTGKFIWPTDGVITSHFGYRSKASTNGIGSTNHPAIDIGAAQGTPVVAADGGTVIYAGTNGGYGNSVGIKHDNGMVTYYNHLYAWNVQVGDSVMQGQEIAQVGSTGNSTGPHLDFKILDASGKPVDPEKLLNKRS